MTEVIALADTASALGVITFDVKLPPGASPGEVMNWSGVPAFSDGYGPARTDIVRRIELLFRQSAVSGPRQ